MVAIVPKLQINSLRLQTDFTELSQIGQMANGGITRVALSNEDLEARAWFANQIEEAGFFVRDDEVGNLSGVMPSTAPHARTLLIGSHLDTVPNGGQYDGSIGVLAGLECMRSIRDAGIELPFHVEVISFTDEEG
ncbi:MAG: M20/M25/M40 family metallo-hydrolase, partial [Anaerolineae bacterium]|nr:M20/M25/M40 family metallo-hydrolase [Anaerolineae bacterium]